MTPSNIISIPRKETNRKCVAFRNFCLRQSNSRNQILILLIATSFWFLLSFKPTHTTLDAVVPYVDNSDYFYRYAENSGFFATAAELSDIPEGIVAYENGKELFEQKKYDEAAMELWKAILKHGEIPPSSSFDVTAVFQQFLQCYIIQNKLVDGFAFVALESFRRGQNDMGRTYLEQAKQLNPNHPTVLSIQEQYATSLNKQRRKSSSSSRREISEANRSKENLMKHKEHQETNQDLLGQTPEQLYEIASTHFSSKNYEECADIFEISCQRSGQKIGPSCANAVYCRSLITDWGYNGSRFEIDMQRVINLTANEVKSNRYHVDSGNGHFESNTSYVGNQFAWQRATSVHPHMMLGYPVDPLLKRYVSESASFLDEKMARVSNAKTGELHPLPSGMPYDIDSYRTRFRQEIDESVGKGANYHLKIGFVGSGFNSKAVLYLSQDMFRFFNTSQYEIHIFSFGPPDNEAFIKHGMRDVDWRERVKKNVHTFHDCQKMKLSHVKAAQYIHRHNIHILIEWDGFARQGERAQGLFALRPAPIQILHQEYLGTSGALYTDYLFTDLVTSPIPTQYLYTEKLIYMPNHFFSKGHAYQKEVRVPTYNYLPKRDPYQFGRGTPQENQCLSNVKNRKVSFVYCNFNKLLKANPETVRSWIHILRQVPNSILCIVENPTTAIPYFRKFVYEAAWNEMNEYDGDDLNSRILFLPWEKNPFDHQARNQDLCNVMLDSHPYNGHTVAQDSLYGGVPIVTRSDGKDMSSRVTTSANVVLGLEQLNAHNGVRQYEEIAIRVGINQTEYNQIRTKLISTCLQRNPMHPYWDVARYVKNFEAGLEAAWQIFLSGKDPEHIFVNESLLARQGTFDEEILSHPTEGTSRVQKVKTLVHSDEL